MNKQDVRQGVILGGFVLGGFLIFLSTLFYLGWEGNLFSKTFALSAIFKNVEGLKEGDNVWLSGVKIGVVKQVQIISEGEVIVIFSLRNKQNQFIRKDATAFVGSDGLVGKKIVIIRPGDSAQIISNNDTIKALSPTDTQELLNIAKDVGVNAKSISDNLKLISARINGGEGVLGELLYNGGAADDLRIAITNLKTASQNTNKISGIAMSLLNEVKQGNGLINKLVYDTAYAVTFQQTLKDISAVGDNSKKISMELEEIISKINTSDNAISVLLTDTLFAHKLRNTLDNAQSASMKLDHNMKAMQNSFLLRGYFKRQKKSADQAKKEVVTINE